MRKPFASIPQLTLLLLISCISACAGTTGRPEPVASPAPPLRSSAPSVSSPSPVADVDRGREVYRQICEICHGPNGEGGPGGGVPLMRAKDQAAVRTQVTYGFNYMPALGDDLSPAQIADVAAYVATEIAD